jgi:serine/threonine protein kinase
MTTVSQLPPTHTWDIPEILRGIHACQSDLARNKLAFQDVEKIIQVYENYKKQNIKGYVARGKDSIARSLLVGKEYCIVLMTCCKKAEDILIEVGTSKKIKFGFELFSKKAFAIGVIKTYLPAEDRSLYDKVAEVHNEIACAKLAQDSPYILRYYGYFTGITQRAHKIFMPMEYCNKKTLFELCGQPLSLDEKFRLVKQLCAGLESIHTQNMVYRDLKPENILLHQNPNEELRVKIGDFGFCLQIDPKQSTPALLKGTTQFLSPELAIARKKYSESSPVEIAQESPARDIWAYGIVLFEFLNPPTKNASFLLDIINDGSLTQEMEFTAIARLTQEHVNKKIVESEIDSRLHPLLQNTLAVDPNLRWTIDQVKQELSKLELLIYA